MGKKQNGLTVRPRRGGNVYPFQCAGFGLCDVVRDRHPYNLHAGFQDSIGPDLSVRYSKSSVICGISLR